MKRKGSAIIILTVLIFGAIGLYFGYYFFLEKNYIALYDGNIVRYLDIPPYCSRETPATHELKGECTIRIGTSNEQMNSFFGSMCHRKGFIFETDENNKKIKISIPGGYAVTGQYTENELILSWDPVLSAKQLTRYRKLFGEPQQDNNPKSAE